MYVDSVRNSFSAVFVKLWIAVTKNIRSITLMQNVLQLVAHFECFARRVCN
jgi:hypothetical protein